MYKNILKKEVDEDNHLPSTRESVYLSELNQAQGYRNVNRIKLSG